MLFRIAEMHYYQFNIGDYVSHTRHLSPIEDIAYRRLLDAYYLQERPLNSSPAAVARQIGMREYEKEVALVLEEFFALGPDGWTNGRADKEIKHFHSKIEQASRAGKASAERRSNARSTDVQPTNNQEPITNNQEPSLSVPNGTDRPSDDEPLKEQKFPGCNHKAVLSLYHSTLPNLPAIEVWNDLRSGLLRQRWREVCQDLAKQGPVTEEKALDWWQKFFEFVGKSDFLTGKTMSKDKRPFLADLEWVIRPANFAKVVEGKYHRS
jgi:uncharacterized protein YdaU (DUF1376 family)